jgi:hypothetical protein
VTRSSGCHELIKRLRKDPAGHTFDELKEILVDYGFTGHERKSGNNVVFTKPDCSVSPALPPGPRPLKQLYVRQVIQALEEGCDE